MLDKKILGLKMFLGPTVLLVKKFGALTKVLVWKKEFSSENKFGSNEVWSKNILGHTNYNPQKIGFKKFGQNWVRYCWYGQMLPGHMLPGRMSPWQFASVKDCPRNLTLKFDQNRVSNSWNIADMDKCGHDICCQENGIMKVGIIC